ncbi:MAG: hypothetical protein RR598_10925 [Anaerorhabdus sp.]
MRRVIRYNAVSIDINEETTFVKEYAGIGNAIYYEEHMTHTTQYEHDVEVVWYYE